jgi:hypothetical protein
MLDVSGSLPHARFVVSTGAISLLHQFTAEQKRQRKQPKEDRSTN